MAKSKRKRDSRIKGTKDFLILTGFCAFLCLWAIRDAWFPTEETLQKHPREIALKIHRTGEIGEINVKEGQSVNPGTKIVKIADPEHESAMKIAREEYKRAKDGGNAEDLRSARKQVERLQREQEKLVLRVRDKYGDYEPYGSMTIKRIMVAPADHVETGDRVALLNPQDNFYFFNKTLTVISFIGFLAFGTVHFIANK